MKTLIRTSCCFDIFVRNAPLKAAAGSTGGHKMMQKAQEVLSDCRHALDLLEGESQPQTFRVLWVAGVALTRAVGHVLQKIDGEQNDATKKAVEAAYASWKADKLGNAIFWEFIEEERNQVLKQYELGFLADPVNVMAGGEVTTLDGHLFCPITDGTFAGEDCRDVLERAIEWWKRQLAEIECAARKVQDGA
ncbi:MAG TPA: hypothetical protein VML01_09415 [Bryobacterales bacterium]|nr:hypothetical protein [Bryobacterales bacterium]